MESSQRKNEHRYFRTWPKDTFPPISRSFPLPPTPNPLDQTIVVLSLC